VTTLSESPSIPRIRLLRFLTVLCLLGFTWHPIAAWAASECDADGDGWYTAEKNQRITLTLVGLTPSKAGDYHVTVEDLWCPHAEGNLQAKWHARADTTLPMEETVSTRTIGAWLAEGKNHGVIAWKTRVTVGRSSKTGVSSSTTVAWSNRSYDQSATVVLASDERVRLDFCTRVERFKDPDPANRNGDADRDGLLDWEEAEYARRGVTLGDPKRADLILVVGYTHADWRMTDLTRTLLRTRFHQRGINLYIAAAEEESLGLCRPGLMTLDGKALPRDRIITLPEARRMRSACLGAPISSDAHLVVLGASVAPILGMGWGYADLPGGTLVVRSHLPVLGPDFHEYQAKTLMHELGHNLGLYHPSERGAGCPSGAVPESERSSAKTVMGTPRSDRGDPVAAIENAWARPLDYSPTQWKNARLDWVRPENRAKRPGRASNR
jgi:hypothetical protein